MLSGDIATQIQTVENTPPAGGDARTLAMNEDKKPTLRRPNVLKKLNTESLQLIERGLLGDLPDRLKPNYVHGPVRGRASELVVAKPSGFLSSCLPVLPDSPIEEKFSNSSDDENVSPLRKSFSFRDRFSRISFLKKVKSPDKPKCKSIVEDERADQPTLSDHDQKASKRFWLFRNKELMEKKQTPVYKRSKSFEFLPKSIEEETEGQIEKGKKSIKVSQSFLVGSSDNMGDAWPSNDSLEYLSNVYYDNDDTVFLKSVKELSSESSKPSSVSTVTTASSGLVVNMLNTDSVQNLLDEFDKAVELFSETYLSDCEPYAQSDKEKLRERRKSASFSTLPSPKVIQVPKVSEVSEDFKKELSLLLSEKRASVCPKGSCRRGSVTDWFVLEDQAARAAAVDKYRRAQKKPMNRVRRMSSTKYILVCLIAVSLGQYLGGPGNMRFRFGLGGLGMSPLMGSGVPGGYAGLGGVGAGLGQLGMGGFGGFARQLNGGYGGLGLPGAGIGGLL